MIKYSEIHELIARELGKDKILATCRKFYVMQSPDTTDEENVL